MSQHEMGSPLQKKKQGDLVNGAHQDQGVRKNIVVKPSHDF